MKINWQRMAQKSATYSVKLLALLIVFFGLAIIVLSILWHPELNASGLIMRFGNAYVMAMILIALGTVVVAL
jgi:type IV secretory pathway VirB6-like protein